MMKSLNQGDIHLLTPYEAPIWACTCKPSSVRSTDFEHKAHVNFYQLFVLGAGYLDEPAGLLASLRAPLVQ